MAASSLLDSQCIQSDQMMSLAEVDDVGELRKRLVAAFFKRQDSRKRIIDQISRECEAGLACKRLATFPEISGGQRVGVRVAFIYVSEETLQGILKSQSFAHAKVSGFVAIDVSPFRMDLPRALLLQSINLLGGKNLAPNDLSHFIALAISKTADSRTLSMAPFGKGLVESFTGFPMGLEADQAIEMVAYGRNLMPNACADIFPTIDLLYDYRAFFERCSAAGRIGYFPEGVSKPKVAVIGAGISGLVVASELLHAGVEDVTLYEASERLGGKLWSHAFEDAPNVIAEMGAMRFPSSESCLFFYLRKYGLASTERFPNPGIVDTQIVYEGRRYTWRAGEGPPKLFHSVWKGWQAFLRDGYLDEDMMLASPNAITEALKLGFLQQAHEFWQSWLTRFERESFSSGIERIFLGANPPGGEQWSFPHDWDLFKLLGVGTGGLGPVFESGFIEILRLLVNGYEDNQQLSCAGISELPRRIASEVLQGVSVCGRVRHVQVEAIEKENARIKVRDKEGVCDLYDRVVVTSGLANIQLRHRMTSDTTFFRAQVNDAVNSSHMTGSSKLFLLTKRKFWLDHLLPPCLLTTGIAKATYCLDYEPQNPEGSGLVLISYTWEDDSHKLLVVPDKKERLGLLRRDIEGVFPDFAKHLHPVNADYDRNVIQHDWLTDENAGGAFKLNRRGDDVYSQRLFFQPLDLMHDTGVYLAGCSCSFTGGWVDGAIQTACNAVCAVIHHSGGILEEGNPIVHSWEKYIYQEKLVKPTRECIISLSRCISCLKNAV
ncbi:NAD(P)-binding protein [Agrobacterium rhizogenes]|nr:NAD(P)-binding protein [Rhizobium rhizogenes]